MQILRTNVNVMDERGLIIASGDRARIGTRHEGALLVLAQGRAVEVDEAVAQRCTIPDRASTCPCARTAGWWGWWA